MHHDKASDDDLERLWGTVEQLDRSLQEMVAAQDYFKNREARHRRSMFDSSACGVVCCPMTD